MLIGFRETKINLLTSKKYFYPTRKPLWVREARFSYPQSNMPTRVLVYWKKTENRQPLCAKQWLLIFPIKISSIIWNTKDEQWRKIVFEILVSTWIFEMFPNKAKQTSFDLLGHLGFLFVRKAPLNQVKWRKTWKWFFAKFDGHRKTHMYMYNITTQIDERDEVTEIAHDEAEFTFVVFWGVLFFVCWLAIMIALNVFVSLSLPPERLCGGNLLHVFDCRFWKTFC